MNTRQVFRIASFVFALQLFSTFCVISQTTIPRPAIYSVRGIIHDKYNYPLSNTQVRVYEKDLRAERLLGSVITDENGYYGISFNVLSAPAALNLPDLFLTVSAVGQSTIAGISDVYYNVDTNTTINFKIGLPPFKALNEFETLYRKVNPVVNAAGIRLGQLLHNEPDNDVTFLSKDLSEDYEKILFLNDAFDRQFKNQGLAYVYYGLFRKGIKIINDKFEKKIDAAILKKYFSQAVEQNIISSEIFEKLDAIIQQLVIRHTAA